MNTKEKIQIASMELFAHESYEATSLTKIAKKVGISKSTIYSHYQKKQDLFLDVINIIIKKQDILLRKVFYDEIDLENKLYNGFKMFSYYWSNQNYIENKLYNKVLLFPPDALKTDIQLLIKDSEKQTFDILKSLFLECQKNNLISSEINISDITLMYNNLIVGSSIQYNQLSIDEFNNMIKNSWVIFWKGIQ